MENLGLDWRILQVQLCGFNNPSLDQSYSRHICKEFIKIGRGWKDTKDTKDTHSLTHVSERTRTFFLSLASVA